MRLFIAINVPPAVREAIYSDAEPLRAATTGVRWVAPESLHVTLKFLGTQDEQHLGSLRTSLESVAQRHSPIAVETTRVGAFPNFRRARVVWVGMTRERELRAIAQDIDRALAPLGISPEARAFRAHLTLGRVKSELGPAEATALAEAAAASFGARRFDVRTVDLMQSKLGRGGSQYSVVAAVPLLTRGT